MKRRLYQELQQSKPAATLEEEVYLEIRRTAEVLGRWAVEALKPSGLTPSQFNVLRILRGAQPEALPACRIGERMLNHDPDLTRLLDRLESAGFVEKARDDSDRRVVNVRITSAGLDVVGRASEAVQARARAELGGIGERRLGELCDLLEKVRCGASAAMPNTEAAMPNTEAAKKKSPRS